MISGKGCHNCCSAYMLYGFGEEVNAEIGYGREQSVESMIEDIEKYKQDCLDEGYAIIVAYTTTRQKKAEEALRACGFRSTRPLKKRKHSETKLRMWTFYLEDLEKKQKPIKVVNPFNK